MQRLEETSTTFAVVFAIVLYSVCSSTLLIANKLALTYLPLSSVVSVIQIVSSTVFVLFIKWYGVKVDNFELKKVKVYLIYIVFFVGSIYSNMQTLSLSNVETLIVFRACVPIATTVVEYVLMGRTLPNLRSALSLLVVATGACVYCHVDSEFKMKGIAAYTWVFIYYILITCEITYAKQLTSSIKMESIWGPVMYTNALAIIPMALIGNTRHEFDDIVPLVMAVPYHGWLVILFSCVAGTAIGYSAWLCRGMMSATTFTLIGIGNKFFTLLLNVLIWDKHASGTGIAVVCVCLLAGVFYQQTPKRADTDDTSLKALAAATTTAAAKDDDDDDDNNNRYNNNDDDNDIEVALVTVDKETHTHVPAHHHHHDIADKDTGTSETESLLIVGDSNTHSTTTATATAASR